MTRTVTASEAKQSFAAVLDAAAREPVVIQRHERDVAVVMSMAEYQRLRGLAVEEFDRVADDMAAKARARGMSPEILADLLAQDD